MSIVKYLKQPFPKQEKKWRLILSISTFIALFLLIFQPFEINLLENSNKHIIMIGYGLVTFCTLVINLIFVEGIFKKFFDERNWTIWKEFTWLLWIIFSIGLGNALYTSIVFGMHLKVNLAFYVHFQFITLVVGVIPITVLILTKQKYLLTKNTHSANELNQSLNNAKKSPDKNNFIRILADNEKDFIEFNLNDFLFIESAGNYIDIHLKEKQKTLRCTIKKSLAFFEDNAEIIQCHRAFIININKVINAKGNSQGLKLMIENCDIEIPVSRNYVNSVKEMIQ